MIARFHHRAWHAVALAAALALGSGAALAAAPSTGAVAYLNGGVGQDSEQQMHHEAAQWPLRLTFSKNANNEFIADVQLKISNERGAEVFALNDAGPMTYVRLAPGAYRVSATHNGKTETRSVHVKGSTQENFHWGS